MAKNAEGKHFSSKFKMNRHAKAHAKDAMPQMHNDNEDTQNENGPDEGDINDVVAQHGPAQEINIHHDHEAGKHKVTSSHDGHTHESEHGTAEEAHEHAKVAAGIAPTEDMGTEADNMGGMGY